MSPTTLDQNQSSSQSRAVTVAPEDTVAMVSETDKVAADIPDAAAEKPVTGACALVWVWGLLGRGRGLGG